MKNKMYKYIRFSLLLALVFAVFTNCERDISDEVEFATFPANGEVFIDGFSAGLNYFPFVADGADPEAFSVVTDDVFLGTSAMRFDIPSFGNGFLGAAFNTTANRDLSGFDALTFYAKASQAVTINQVGFGVSAETANKFLVSASNMKVSTRWEKYVVPIPDPSKLINETGLLFVAEGASFEGDEGGYVLLFDEVQFEKTGTLAQPRPKIFDGNDLIRQTFNGSNIVITGLTQTFNTATGVNQTVNASPSYFTFSSTNPDVARVNELGQISVVGAGTAKVTAIIGGVKAEGSIEITSTGDIVSAPIPPFPASEVISLFSNQYPNVAVDTYRADFGGTDLSEITVNGDDFKFYTNLDFVGIQFQNPTIDATGKGSLFMDIYTNDVAGSNFQIQVRDRGTNGQLDTNIFTGQPTEDDAEVRLDLTPAQIPAGQWITVEIPLTGSLTNQKSNLAQIVFVGDIDFLLDNVYFR